MNEKSLLEEKQPEVVEAFRKLMEASLAEGVFPVKVKELIAMSVGLAINCPDCVQGHTEHAIKAGATPEEIAETLSVTLSCLGCSTFPRAKKIEEVLKKSRKWHVVS
jgi:AhpD family alkylhydroperoxidase